MAVGHAVAALCLGATSTHVVTLNTLQSFHPSGPASLLQQVTAVHTADDDTLCQVTMTVMKGMTRLMTHWQEQGRSSQRSLQPPCTVKAREKVLTEKRLYCNLQVMELTK